KVHLLQRTLLKGYLPAVPCPDDAAIDNEVAAGTLETCANSDPLSRLEKRFNHHPQSVRNGIGQFLWCQLLERCGLFALCRAMYRTNTCACACLLRPSPGRMPIDTGDSLGAFRLVKPVLNAS